MNAVQAAICRGGATLMKTEWSHWYLLAGALGVRRDWGTLDCNPGGARSRIGVTDSLAPTLTGSLHAVSAHL